MISESVTQVGRPSGGPDATRPDPARIAQMRARAAELEGFFLAEMLAHAGMAPMQGSFGGGMGEEQFSSFLRQEQAAAMVRRGGIGLAEQLFQAMMRSEGHG